jgi:hypothetical protein
MTVPTATTTMASEIKITRVFHIRAHCFNGKSSRLQSNEFPNDS